MTKIRFFSRSVVVLACLSLALPTLSAWALREPAFTETDTKNQTGLEQALMSGTEERETNLAILRKHLGSEWKNWPEVYDELMAFVNRGIQGYLPSGRVVEIEESSQGEDSWDSAPWSPPHHWIRVDTRNQQLRVHWKGKRGKFSLDPGDGRLVSMRVFAGPRSYWPPWYREVVPLIPYLEGVLGGPLVPGELHRPGVPNELLWETEVSAQIVGDPESKNLKVTYRYPFNSIAIDENRRIRGYGINPISVLEDLRAAYKKGKIPAAKGVLLEIHSHPRSTLPEDDAGGRGERSGADLFSDLGLWTASGPKLQPVNSMVFFVDESGKLIGEGHVNIVESSDLGLSKREVRYRSKNFRIVHSIIPIVSAGMEEGERTFKDMLRRLKEIFGDDDLRQQVVDIQHRGPKPNLQFAKNTLAQNPEAFGMNEEGLGRLRQIMRQYEEGNGDDAVFSVNEEAGTAFNRQEFLAALVYFVERGEAQKSAEAENDKENVYIIRGYHVTAEDLMFLEERLPAILEAARKAGKKVVFLYETAGVPLEGVEQALRMTHGATAAQVIENDQAFSHVLSDKKAMADLARGLLEPTKQLYRQVFREISQGRIPSYVVKLPEEAIF